MPADMLKIKARDEFVRLTEKDLATKLSTLSDKQKSIAATKFYIREIHNPLGAYISEEDLIEGVVDGKNDLGCDFIHRDDGHVIIIQSKFRSFGSEEGVTDISHHQSILKRFHDTALVSNKYLSEALGDIDWENDSFELVYVTFGKLTGQPRQLTGMDPAYPANIAALELRCEWKYFDEEDLNIELRNARNLQRGASDKTIKLYPVGEKGSRGSESVVEVDAGDYK